MRVAPTEAVASPRARLETARIAVVIPCYRVEKQVGSVIDGIPDYVKTIIAVDDASPDGTWEVLEQLKLRHRNRLITIRHAQNQGVGGAVVSGYREALTRGAEVVIKLDGDGQMDPSFLPYFAWPVIAGSAEYVKGNRFRYLADGHSMPLVRRFGNLALSFLMRAASGYWNLLDPTNGYTAISGQMLRQLDLDRIEKRYLFESCMLVHLYRARARVIEVPMKARYADEESSLSVSKVSLQLSAALIRWLLTRIWRTYYWDGFSLVSIFLFVGTICTLFGVLFGAHHWYLSYRYGVPATAGTVMLASIPVILGFEMLLHALVLDTQNVPASPPLLDNYCALEADNRLND